jgi:hypothetical protein
MLAPRARPPPPVSASPPLAGKLFWAGLNYTQVLEYMLFWDAKNGPPTLCEEKGEPYLTGIVDRAYALELRKLNARV